MVVGFTSIYAIGGTAVVVIDGGWIYNYLCNQCLSPLFITDAASVIIRSLGLINRGINLIQSH